MAVLAVGQGLYWRRSSHGGGASPLRRSEEDSALDRVGFYHRFDSDCGVAIVARLSESDGRVDNAKKRTATFDRRTFERPPAAARGDSTEAGHLHSSKKQAVTLPKHQGRQSASQGKFSTLLTKSNRDSCRKASTGTQIFVDKVGSKAQRNLRHLLFSESGESSSLALLPNDTLWSFLHDALKQRNWRGALDVFEAMKQVQGYTANIRIYTMMVRIMAKSKQPYRAFQLFEEMEGAGCGRDVSAFTALLDAYGRSGLLEQAVAVFEQMKTTPACKPNVYTYNCMINAYGRAQLWDKIDDLTKEMDDFGLKPLDMTFNVLISAYGKGALYDRMERVFDRMQKAGCTPDVFTFNTMIDVYGKGLQYSQMEQTYSRMLAANLDPDILTFSSLMNAYRKAGMDERVEETLAQMCTAGCKPDVKAYSLLIDIYGKRGRLEKMEATLKEMQSAGCRANVVTYTGILDAYGKAGLYEQVEEVWLSLNNVNLKPDISAYVTMLAAYGKGGLLDKMEMVFEELKAVAKDMKIVGPKPGCPAYNVVIDSYGKGKVINKMEKAFKEMQQTGHKPSVITYTALIDGYGKAGLYKKMERVYLTMQVTGCAPNVHTYGSLMDGYGQLGMVKKMEKVVEDQQKAGFSLDLITYTCILDAYGRAKDFKTLATKFNEMTEAGFQPSYVTVGAILSSLGSCQTWDDAADIIQCLQHGPVFGVIGRLLQDKENCDGSDLLEDAENLFDKLQESGPQFVLYDALIEVLWSFGWQKRAIQVLNLGRRKGAFPHTRVYSGTEIVLDLHMLSSHVAEVMILAWFIDLKEEILDVGVSAEQVTVVTGWGKRSKVEGASPLKAAVSGRLALMGSPFYIPPENLGRLIAPLRDVSSWLLSERMESHLSLRDAAHPGPGHNLKQWSSFK